MHQKSQCCGCTACEKVCPVQCISMQPDEEGFLYPVIQEDTCIHCKKCETVCPIMGFQPPAGKTRTYVGYTTREEIRKESSSGGIFTLAAESVLKQGGVVYGAAFDETFAVRHICVESEGALSCLRGSKYVQSSLDDCFLEVKKHLEDGRLVLFSGTACQIAGLKKYLGRNAEKLLTIDVLCHGVPSPKIWKQHLEELQKQYGAKIASIRLRDKELGWKRFSTRIRFENEQEYAVPFHNDPYMNLFLGNVDLRPSCYECRFKDFPRVSDMTIGDCWGVEKKMPEMDDDKGTSVMMIHTPRGEELFRTIREQLAVKDGELDRVLSPRADSRRSVDVHPNRKKFWEAVARGENMTSLRGYCRKNLFQRILGVVRYRMK